MAYQKKTRAKAIDGRTSKQWAWEFLRRNPVYRRAYSEIQILGPTDRVALQSIGSQGFSALRDAQHLQAKWFGFLPVGPTAPDEPVAKFVENVEKNWEGETPDVSLLPMFDLATYSLSDWLNPNTTPLAAEDSLKIGVLELAHAEYFRPRTELDDLKEAELLPLDDAAEWDETGMYVEESRAERLADIAAPAERSFFYEPLRKSNTRAKAASFSFAGATGTTGSPWVSQFPIPQLAVLRSSDVLLRIDLNLPLRPQIKAVEAILKGYQASLERDGLCPRFPHRIDRGGIFPEYLELLDLSDTGSTPLDIARSRHGVKSSIARRRVGGKMEPVQVIKDRAGFEITATSPVTKRITKQLERAVQLRDAGFLGLAFLP